MKISRLMSIAYKETRHILRDPFTLVLAFGLPLFLVVFFGFAIDFEVKNIKLSVYDADRTPASRRLQQIFSSSGYFKLIEAENASLQSLEKNDVTGAMFIKPDFGKNIISGANEKVQFVFDGSDNSKTGVIAGYLQGVQNSINKNIAGYSGHNAVKIKTRFLFNPELNSRWFTIPGITAIVVGLMGILLTALTIAGEKEKGSMELLLSTHVEPSEIVLGKIIPYFFIVFFSVIFVCLASYFIFGVPFKGSIYLFFFVCFLFIAASLSQGLLISVITGKQQAAMLVSVVTSLLPAMLLSGFVFPIESMPVFFRYLTVILAPRWYMEAVRGIFLKGAAAVDLITPIIALSVICVLLVSLAIKKFKVTLD